MGRCLLPSLALPTLACASGASTKSFLLNYRNRQVVFQQLVCHEEPDDPCNVDGGGRRVRRLRKVPIISIAAALSRAHTCRRDREH